MLRTPGTTGRNCTKFEDGSKKTISHKVFDGA